MQVLGLVVGVTVANGQPLVAVGCFLAGVAIDVLKQ